MLPQHCHREAVKHKLLRDFLAEVLNRVHPHSIALEARVDHLLLILILLQLHRPRMRRYILNGKKIDVKIEYSVREKRAVIMSGTKKTHFERQPDAYY